MENKYIVIVSALLLMMSCWAANYNAGTRNVNSTIGTASMNDPMASTYGAQDYTTQNTLKNPSFASGTYAGDEYRNKFGSNPEYKQNVKGMGTYGAEAQTYGNKTYADKGMYGTDKYAYGMNYTNKENTDKNKTTY